MPLGRIIFPCLLSYQMLDMLAGRSRCCLLDGYLGYNQISISLEDKEKTSFTCQYGIFAFRKISFGLCNTLTTFQRCMMIQFADIVENIMKVYINDLSVLGIYLMIALEV